MSPRDWRGRIRDILDAIAEIQQFTRGMEYEDSKKDAKTVRAVEMNFASRFNLIAGIYNIELKLDDAPLTFARCPISTSKTFHAGRPA